MISYSAEGVGMPKIKRREVTAWVKRVAQSWGKRVGDIGYLFCSDEHILQVNRQYLGHDYYTDIITFDYCEGDIISGDLVISLDTVRTNSQLYDQHYDSRRFSSPYEAELYRVIIHGVLHLCGQDDKGPGQREQMEAAENRALDLLRA